MWHVHGVSLWKEKEKKEKKKKGEKDFSKFGYSDDEAGRSKE